MAERALNVDCWQEEGLPAVTTTEAGSASTSSGSQHGLSACTASDACLAPIGAPGSLAAALDTAQVGS